MKILAIVVTFNPNLSALNTLLKELQPQVDFIAIIDNNSCPKVPPLKIPDLTFISNSQNQGVAFAYNQGIELAMHKGATHILLLDQDSLPAHDMVRNLKYSFEKFESQMIAAAGPKYTDIKGQKTSPFVSLRGLGLKRIECSDEQQVYVDHLISSGSLLSIKAIEKIGTFEDLLFIDYVDTEWCWRARRMGFKLIGVGSAHMQHSIGEDYFRLFSRNISLHSPERLYYQFRNRYWMSSQSWVGWRWRLMDLLRGIKIFIAFMLAAPRRVDYLKHIVRGLSDGVRKKMGKYNQKQCSVDLTNRRSN